MNVQKKTILTIIIAILCIIGLIGYVYANTNSKSDTDKLREDCSAMKSDACIELSKISKEQKEEAIANGIKADAKIAEIMS